MEKISFVVKEKTKQPSAIVGMRTATLEYTPLVGLMVRCGFSLNPHRGTIANTAFCSKVMTENSDTTSAFVLEHSKGN